MSFFPTVYHARLLFVQTHFLHRQRYPQHSSVYRQQRQQYFSQCPNHYYQYDKQQQQHYSYTTAHSTHEQQRQLRPNTSLVQTTSTNNNNTINNNNNSTILTAQPAVFPTLTTELRVAHIDLKKVSAHDASWQRVHTLICPGGRG